MKLPELVWTSVTALEHIDINNFLDELVRLANENRPVALDYAAGVLKFDWVVRNKRKLDLTIYYLLFKLLTIGSLFINLAIIQFVFGEPDRIFGFQLIYQLTQRIPWRETSMFPRIVQCLIWRNEAESATPHVISCVLPLNTIYEKLILAIWVWLLVLLCLSIISLLYWTCKLLIPQARQTMIDNVLEVVQSENDNQIKLMNFLNREKCLIFSLISFNVDYNFYIETLVRLLSDDSSENYEIL